MPVSICAFSIGKVVNSCELSCFSAPDELATTPNNEAGRVVTMTVLAGLTQEKSRSPESSAEGVCKVQF